MKAIIVALVLASIPNLAWADDCSDPFVKTPQDAGWVAFTAWHVLYPNFNETDEQKWASDFTITLHDCVWSISSKPASNHGVKIGAKDGRFLESWVD